MIILNENQIKVHGVGGSSYMTELSDEHESDQNKTKTEQRGGGVCLNPCNTPCVRA